MRITASTAFTKDSTTADCPLLRLQACTLPLSHGVGEPGDSPVVRKANQTLRAACNTQGLESRISARLHVRRTLLLGIDRSVQVWRLCLFASLFLSIAQLLHIAIAHPS